MAHHQYKPVAATVTPASHLVGVDYSPVRLMR